MLMVAASGKPWMYSNWAPDLMALTISDQLLDPGGLNTDATRELVRFWAKAVTRGIFAVYLGWELVRLWRMAGDREKSRTGEKIGSAVLGAFNAIGIAKKYREIHGDVVAKAMINAALDPAGGTKIFELDEVFAEAERST